MSFATSLSPSVAVLPHSVCFGCRIFGAIRERSRASTPSCRFLPASGCLCVFAACCFANQKAFLFALQDGLTDDVMWNAPVSGATLSGSSVTVEFWLKVPLLCFVRSCVDLRCAGVGSSWHICHRAVPTAQRHHCSAAAHSGLFAASARRADIASPPDCCALCRFSRRTSRRSIASCCWQRQAWLCNTPLMASRARSRAASSSPTRPMRSASNTSMRPVRTKSLARPALV
mgnify:CR=1 FL=1